MDSTQITALTGAFSTDSLVTTFVGLAPFILGVAGVVVAISLVKWGIRKVARKASGGAA